jgi:hypothetical protein
LREGFAARVAVINPRAADLSTPLQARARVSVTWPIEKLFDVMGKNR